MFVGFFDRFKFIKRLRDHIEFKEKYIDRIIEDLKEELMILKKIVPVFEHRSLAIPSSFSFLHGFDSPSREEHLDKERKKLREDGFHFVFKRKHGEEIWIKPGQIDTKANTQIS